MPYIAVHLFTCFYSGVADPQHFIADPDPAFHLNTDPDTCFHFNADPDPAPHQSDENLRPLVYGSSRDPF
jgi:hypothetical protein